MRVFVRKTLLLGYILMSATVLGVLSGCAGGAADPSPPTASVPVADTMVPRDPTVASETIISPVVLPFAEYFSVARQAQTTAIDRWYEENAKSFTADQQEIGKCMTQAGFKWFPVEFEKPEVDIDAGNTLAIPALPANRADVEKYGYGFMSLSEEGTVSETESKLNEYLESLGEEGAAAFTKTLLQDPGCGKSLEDGNSYLEDASWYQDPVDAMRRLFIGDKDALRSGSMMSDERLIGLNAEWGQCMVENKALNVEDINRDPDMPGPRNAFDVAIGTGADGSRSISMGGSADFDKDHMSLSGSKYEIAIATADYDCRESTEYVKRFATIQADLESQWVASNKQILDQMLNTWEQVRAK